MWQAKRGGPVRITEPLASGLHAGPCPQSLPGQAEATAVLLRDPRLLILDKPSSALGRRASSKMHR